MTTSSTVSVLNMFMWSWKTNTAIWVWSTKLQRSNSQPGISLTHHENKHKIMCHPPTNTSLLNSHKSFWCHKGRWYVLDTNKTSTNGIYLEPVDECHQKRPALTATPLFDMMQKGMDTSPFWCHKQHCYSFRTWTASLNGRSNRLISWRRLKAKHFAAGCNRGINMPQGLVLPSSMWCFYPPRINHARSLHWSQEQKINTWFGGNKCRPAVLLIHSFAWLSDHTPGKL